MKHTPFFKTFTLNTKYMGGTKIVSIEVQVCVCWGAGRRVGRNEGQQWIDNPNPGCYPNSETDFILNPTLILWVCFPRL